MSLDFAVPARDRVLAALLDPIPLVRHAAARWFEGQVRTPAGADPFAPVMQAIEAYERFGGAAFPRCEFLSSIPRSAAAADWFIEHGPGLPRAPQRNTAPLEAFVCNLPANLLRSHGAALRAACLRGGAKGFPEREFRTVEKHGRRAPAELWRMALTWCADADEGDSTLDAKLAAAAELLAVGPEPQAFAAEALAILADPQTGNSWEEALAIHYLCRAGVAAAAAPIAARLFDDELGGDGTSDAAGSALQWLPSAAVIAALRAAPNRAEVLSHAGFFLDQFRDPEAVALSLELAAESTDAEFGKCFLLCAALRSLAPAAAPPATAFLATAEIVGEPTAVLDDLAALAAFHGLDEPELPGFQAAAAALKGTRPAWAKEMLAGMENLGSAAPQDDDDAAAAGRNDPCPCGSGRKFKKCCLKTPLSADRFLA